MTRTLRDGTVVVTARGEDVTAQQLIAAAGYTIAPVRRPVTTLARRFGRRVRSAVRTTTRTTRTTQAARSPGRRPDDDPPQGGNSRPVEAQS